MRRETGFILSGFCLIALLATPSLALAKDAEFQNSISDPLAYLYVQLPALPADPMPPERAPLEITEAEGVADIGGLPMSLVDVESELRFRENDMLFKFRAPGDGQSLATFEVIF